MISCDSSGSVGKDLGVQYGGPWFKCWSVTFLTFLLTFLPCSDCSIRVFRPHDLQLFGFCLVTL